MLAREGEGQKGGKGKKGKREKSSVGEGQGGRALVSKYFIITVIPITRDRLCWSYVHPAIGRSERHIK